MLLVRVVGVGVWVATSSCLAIEVCHNWGLGSVLLLLLRHDGLRLVMVLLLLLVRVLLLVLILLLLELVLLVRVLLLVSSLGRGRIVLAILMLHRDHRKRRLRLRRWLMMIMNSLHCRSWWKLCSLCRFLIFTATVPKEQGSSQNDNSYTCSNSCVETRVTAASLVRGTAVAVVASRTRARTRAAGARGDGVV